MLPQPEPAAGLDVYHAERRLRLDGSLECRSNYDRYLRRRNGVVDYLPIKLDIENVSRCNYRCGMCPVSEWPGGKRAGDLSFESFKRVIDEQAGLLEIKLQGLGEPTMQGGDFFRMIRYARDRHIWVRTTTNASLLHLKNNTDDLADSGVNEVQISIDGATKAVFEAVRPQSDWHQVCRNVASLNHAFVERDMVRTKMWAVVQKTNRHQLADLVTVAADLGFRHLVFSLEVSGTSGAALQAEPVSLIYAQALVAMGLAVGVRVAFWSATLRYDRENLCPWPFERAYLSSDRRLVPCCVIGNPDVFELGNAEAGVSAVWDGNEMAEFRATHLSGNIPDVCKGCYKS